MHCPICQSEARRFGKDRHKNQRFQCLTCKKTWTDIPARPLGSMRINLDDACRVLQLLLEGMSVRAAARCSGMNRSTILDLMVMVGERCETMLAGRIKNHPVVDVQCDEIWSFVQMKEKTRQKLHPDEAEIGDAYCFTAIERESKLLVAWHLGTRCREDTIYFAAKLGDATTGRFQLTTDGFKPYKTVMPLIIPDADFAQLIKEYATLDHGKYSPGEVIGVEKRKVNGHPKEEKICTSHVERANLTIRMQNRRFTRLTNAFSKKWRNHQAALALQFAFYNFVRVHQTLKMTPAMKAGLETRPWTIRDLIEKSTQS